LQKKKYTGLNPTSARLDTKKSSNTNNSSKEIVVGVVLSMAGASYQSTK
jgi:hypothetical protein